MKFMQRPDRCEIVRTGEHTIAEEGRVELLKQTEAKKKGRSSAQFPAAIAHINLQRGAAATTERPSNPCLRNIPRKSRSKKDGILRSVCPAGNGHLSLGLRPPPKASQVSHSIFLHRFASRLLEGFVHSNL